MEQNKAWFISITDVATLANDMSVWKNMYARGDHCGMRFLRPLVPKHMEVSKEL